MKLSHMYWYDIYKELSEALFQLYQKSDNPGEELYLAVENDKGFVSQNKWFEKFSLLRSLDPIHIFSAISANNLKEHVRTDKVLNILDLLTHTLKKNYISKVENSDYYEIDYTGCPAPPAIHSLSMRDKEKQREIWEAFVSIYKMGQECDLKSFFEQSKNWYGVSHRLLTIFMFWVNSDNFLPLDRNTVRFLASNLEGFSEPKDGKKYRSLLKYKNVPVYRDIALMSYDPNYYYNLKNISLYERFFGKEAHEFNTVRHNFKILGIKPLNECNPKNLKSLMPERVYKLDQGFNLRDDGNVEYKEEYKLFSLDSMSINFSAIVGKNGTGKSTLVELVVACLNNIAFSLFKDKKEIKLSFIKSIFAELYFYTDRLYKVTLGDKKIDIISFDELEGNLFAPSDDLNLNLNLNLNLKSIKFSQLFYSLLVNYSLHGLNERQYEGAWLNKLFHKNDGYQTPVVIEPFRKNGVIDVNIQDELAKTRLIHNLLLPIGNDDSSRILKRGKSKNYLAHSFKLCTNHSKLTDTIQEYKRSDSSPDDKGYSFKVSEINTEGLLFKLFQKFQCEIDEVDQQGCHYIIRKLLLITLNYEKYHRFFHLQEGKYQFLDIDTFFDELRRDNSHMTAKLRRAINHYKFNLYRSTSASYLITDVSEKIEGILTDSSSNKSLVKLPEDRLEFLLPPSFFNLHIYLEDGIEFAQLSSGEKQIIYSINSITYHLRNLDSVLAESEKAKYNFVNIFLDEIELCFHPELQRLYLNELYHTLKRFNGESVYISGVNICFITHSPFVLSDIPEKNVLFLKHDDKYDLISVPFESSTKTFAANIHDLLNDGFFVSNTIGAFSEVCIKEILSFNLKVKKADLYSSESKKRIEQEFKDNKDRFSYVVSSLGDTYIKPLIESSLTEIVEILELTDIKNELKQEKIKALEKELEQLKSNVKD